MEGRKVRDINKEALQEVYGNPEELKKQYEKEIKDLGGMIQGTFSTDYGEQCLQWLEDSFVNVLSFDPESARQTDFNEGCRHVVMTIKAFIKQEG